MSHPSRKPIDISERIRLHNIRIRRMLKNKYGDEWQFVIDGQGRGSLRHIAQPGKSVPTQAEQDEVVAAVKLLGMSA